MPAVATLTTTDFIDPELGEQTPLLLSSSTASEPPPLENIQDWTRREQAVAGVSALSFAASLAGMMSTPEPLVLVSGTIGCAVAPYVAIQQQKITHVEALEETNQRVELEVAQLKEENKKFMAQVHEMTQSVQSLKQSKEKLDTIASVQGASLDKLEKQLEATRNIYSKLQQNLQGDILNNLIDIALACDDNQDMVLSDEEIDDVIRKLEQVHGIDVDNEGVRRVLVQNGRSMDAIMEIVKNLLRDDIPLEQNLFKESKKLSAVTN